MRLTTKGRFAVTAMIDLALPQQSGPVTLSAISQRQNISLSYLEQLFGKLRRHELVESVRGPGGGYTLNRDANHISVADIIYAVNSPDAIEQLPADAEQNGRRLDHLELNRGVRIKQVALLSAVVFQHLILELAPEESSQSWRFMVLQLSRQA